MSKYIQFKVKDIHLAEWGRREIKLAEAEMPGLMSLRKEFGKNKPLKGARIVRKSFLNKPFHEIKNYLYL